VITGMALGADLSLPPAIQADVLDYDRWKFKRARAGVQFAMWGMATKLALAVSVGIALPSLEGLGFTPEAPTPDGIWALIFLYGVVPIGIKVLAIAMVWNFPITATKHAIIRKRLQQRDAATDL
jgi:GPH family glycoside/pentoside/hexuronide:cation symporter